MAQSQLKDPITNVLPSASTDENRYILNGIFFDRVGSDLALVATDGRRLSRWMVALEGEGSDFKAIVPNATMQQVESLLTLGEKVKVEFNDRAIRFTFEVKDGDKDGLVSQVVVQSKLVEGNYPNYKVVLPKGDKHSEILIDRAAFLAATSRGKLLLSDKSYSVKLEVIEDSLVISGSSSDFGASKEELKLNSKHSAARVALNPDFILDAISGLPGENVRFLIADENSPIVLKDMTGAFTSVIMPLRLN